MPYKSDSQRRYFHAAEERGDISHKTVNEFDQASKGKHLPEKVKHMMAGGEACSNHGAPGSYYEGGDVEGNQPEVDLNPSAPSGRYESESDSPVPEMSGPPSFGAAVHRKRVMRSYRG